MTQHEYDTKLLYVSMLNVRQYKSLHFNTNASNVFFFSNKATVEVIFHVIFLTICYIILKNKQANGRLNM